MRAFIVDVVVDVVVVVRKKEEGGSGDAWRRKQMGSDSIGSCDLTSPSRLPDLKSPVQQHQQHNPPAQR